MNMCAYVSVLWSRLVALIVVRAASIEAFECLNQGVNHSFVELCGMVTGQIRRFFVMLYKSYSIFVRLFSKNRYFSIFRSLTTHVYHNFYHFYVYQSLKMGGPPISSANRKSAYLRTYTICQIYGLSANFALCEFAFSEPNLFCNLQFKNSTSLQLHAFLLTNIVHDDLIHVKIFLKRRLL